MIASVSSGLNEMGLLLQPPERQDFGYLVITELVAQALQGTAKLDFTPDGIHWRLDIPATQCACCAGNNNSSNDMISLATYSNPAQLWLAAAAAQVVMLPKSMAIRPTWRRGRFAS